MLNLKKVSVNDDAINLFDLATTIWKEHYAKVLGTDQANYMASKFQSLSVIKQQISDKNEFYVIEKSGKDIGYLAYQVRDSILFIDKIYLLNEFRGQSTGSFCLNFIETKAGENNYLSLTLKVEQRNIQAIKTFKKWGFKITESITRDIGNGFTLKGYLMIRAMSIPN